MKKIITTASIAVLLLLSGCGQTQPTPGDTEAVETGNASVLNENSTSSDSNEMNIARLENKFSSVHFDFDKYALTSETQGKIPTYAEIANSSASAYKINLEGNCDEWGSDEYNFALGLKRADAVKKALIAEGVDASRIHMKSNGELNPTCADKTRACWAENRRVDFKLLP